MKSSATLRRLDPIPLEEPISALGAPTPALLVDVEAMERNLAKMAAFLASRGKAARPHTKTHKCPVIAKRQLAHGAVGLCCAKVSEAEVMTEAGLGPLLVTSPIVTRDKIERFVRLASRAPEAPALVVDDLEAASRLNQAAAEAGVSIEVLIDLDPGTRRTGVAFGQPALTLARHLQALPRLRLRGLQAYAGHLMHVEGQDERRRRSREALDGAVETKRLIEADGIELELLTGGGTGTFDIDVEIEEVTDLQVGSYLLMDVEYGKIGGPGGGRFDAFEPALYVLTTAISQPREGLITVDAGFKAIATDTVLPELADIQGVRYRWGGDEHGILQLDAPSEPIRLGDRIRLRPSHCDPTINLYDLLHPVEAGEVRELWPISARGCSQ